MTAKLPPELHIVKGTKGENMGIPLPENLRTRIPQAEWMDNPDAWNKPRFVLETSNYLYDLYGLGSDQDKHSLAMLADQIDTYIDCNRHIAVEGLVTSFNDGKTIGPSPYVSIRKEALKLIVVLMNELGLTPKGRLSKTSTNLATNSMIGRLLQGPQVKR